MFMFFARAKPQLVLVDEIICINSRMASHGSVSEDRHEETSVIRGHHVYKSVWTPEVGKELSLVTEDGNEHDKYAVAVIKDGYVVGHMPRSLSRVSWYFLKRGGCISCRVTGRRKLGVGLEVPCVYVYHGSSRSVEKLRRLLSASDDMEMMPLSCPS